MVSVSTHPALRCCWCCWWTENLSVDTVQTNVWDKCETDCERCFKLVKPLTWSVLKGKHVWLLLFFLVDLGGSWKGNMRACSHPAAQWPWFESPQQYLHNVHCLQGPLRHCLSLAETLKSWIEVAAGRGFLSFITEHEIGKKKKKQSDSQKCQVKHMWIGLERWWSPASPGDTHPDGRRAAWLNECAAVGFLASRGQMKPSLYSSSFKPLFLQKCPRPHKVKTGKIYFGYRHICLKCGFKWFLSVILTYFLVLFVPEFMTIFKNWQQQHEQVRGHLRSSDWIRTH